MAILKLQFLSFSSSPSSSQTPSIVSLQSSDAFIFPSPKQYLPPSSFSPSASPFTSQSRARIRVSLDCNQDKAHDEILRESGEDLGEDSEVFKKTLRLVECSMFASVAGLAYLLNNSLAIENYFSCFFSLPIVISSMRWGLAAGRKTMVATAMLLLTLSGPVKASTYLVRALGAVGYVLISSFLIRENILNLITINVHASLAYILMAIGVNTIPSMDTVYTIFGSLLLLNSAFFVFLLHILYAVFLTKLGMKESLTLPRWLERAI